MYGSLRVTTTHATLNSVHIITLVTCLAHASFRLVHNNWKRRAAVQRSNLHVGFLVSWIAAEQFSEAICTPVQRNIESTATANYYVQLASHILAFLCCGSTVAAPSHGPDVLILVDVALARAAVAAIHTSLAVAVVALAITLAAPPLNSAATVAN